MKRDHETTCDENLVSRKADSAEIHGLYERARDLAARMLGDPFEADRITRRVFADFDEDGPFRPEDQQWVGLYITDELVRLCLVRTGNPEVADWQKYQDTHPDKEEEEEKRRRRRLRAKRSVASPEAAAVLPHRPHAHRSAAAGQATRAARQVLRIAQMSVGPKATDDANVVGLRSENDS